MDTITVDGARLAYQLDGPAHSPPLVFINSLGCDHRMWDGQVAAFSATRRVIRYDVRGHGASGAAGQALTLARLGQDLLALLDHLGVARTDLCGLSLGGAIAQQLAIHHPERVARAVFANTAARIGTEQTWDARIALVRQGGMAAVQDSVLGRFFSAAFRAQHSALVAAFAATLLACDPLEYAAICAALRATDLRPLVASIRCPVLVIGAAQDESTPAAQAEELHAAIPGSQLAILPDTAHLSNLGQPDLFNAQIQAFLTE